MYNTVYETLICIGFTPEQIASAKRISSTRDLYEVSTPARTYKVGLARFEEDLGHGRGYDRAIVYWDYHLPWNYHPPNETDDE